MIATFGKQFKGNVSKWDKQDCNFENNLPKLIRRNEFCSNPKQIFLFPFPTFQEEAFHICIVHGGDLFVSEKYLENAKLKKLMKPFLEKCDPNQMTVGSWLGFSREDNNMVRNTSSGTKLLNFTNWDMTPMTIDDCVVFTSNGFWDKK